MTNLILLSKVGNVEVLCEPGMYLTYSASLYFKQNKKIKEISIPHNEVAESTGEFVLSNEHKMECLKVLNEMIEDQEELEDFTVILLKEKYRNIMDLYWVKKSSLGEPVYKDKSFSVYNIEE